MVITLTSSALSKTKFKISTEGVAADPKPDGEATYEKFDDL